MEHCAPHTRAVHMATCLEREGTGRTDSTSLTSSRQLEVHSHRLLTACLLGSKRKLSTPACQVRLGLPCVVCCPRGVQFSGTMYTCNQGPLSGARVHCTSYAPTACSHCKRCCCCPIECHRWCMETHLNSAGGPRLYHRS